MKIIGKPTIHPLLFYSGKLIGYCLWILFLLAILNIELLNSIKSIYSNLLSYLLIVISIGFVVMSSINLGKSTRLGLPDELTVLKTSGIYKISRNPMYVGFDLLTIAAIIGNFNAVYLLFGVYSLIIYHLIILGEEKFLQERFGIDYTDYRAKVRRYI